jgi:hypothetical protein
VSYCLRGSAYSRAPCTTAAVATTRWGKVSAKAFSMSGLGSGTPPFSYASAAAAGSTRRGTGLEKSRDGPAGAAGRLTSFGAGGGGRVTFHPTSAASASATTPVTAVATGKRGRGEGGLERS